MTYKRISTLHALCALSVCLISTCAHGASLSEYNRTLGDASSRMQTAIHMETAHPGSSKHALEGLAHNLPKSIAVEMPGGRRINSDMRWLRDGLLSSRTLSVRKKVDYLTRLTEQAQSLIAVNASLPQNNPGSIRHARSVLRSVVKHDEYRHSWLGDKVMEALGAIGNVIGGVIENIIRHVPGSAIGWVGRVLAVIIVIAFAAMLVYIAVKLVSRYSKKVAAEDAIKEWRELKSTRPSMESLMESAESHAAGGLYRAAYRDLYLASILLLDRAKIIIYADGSTNWEYIRAIRRQSLNEHAAIFGDMTLVFDRLIYGHGDISANDYTLGTEQFHRLEGMV